MVRVRVSYMERTCTEYGCPEQTQTGVIKGGKKHSKDKRKTSMVGAQHLYPYAPGAILMAPAECRAIYPREIFNVSVTLS